MLFFYNIFIHLYYFGIRLASTWNKKAFAWVEGRRNVLEELEKKIGKNELIIWMHCSSAGEFEQGKPIIEALKKDYPLHKILVSFFSPSGFSSAKNYPAADYITYLPLDTRRRAERFIKIARPQLVIFVKYEFWYHHLAAAAFHHIPILLVSAVFRKEQVFFKAHGKFLRQILFLFRHIFVQDKNSLQLLQQNGIDQVSIGGDTRFDRVTLISQSFTTIPAIEGFLQNQPCIVAGSTWKDDEELLQQYELRKKAGFKLIIAPHEIHPSHLAKIKQLFSGAIFYSDLASEKENATDIIVIDNVGMLSRLYKYATVTYVGGGFTKDGIHNILEAAVWGKPVIFGPNYKKYREASELIEAGGGFSVNNGEKLTQLAERLFTDDHYLQQVSAKAKNYIRENTGATQKVVQWIQEKRLLTN